MAASTSAAAPLRSRFCDVDVSLARCTAPFTAIAYAQSALRSYPRSATASIYKLKANPLSRISVFACESQPIVIEGLAKVLAGYEEFDYLGSAAALGDAFTAVRQSQPDIVLVDHSTGLKAVFEFIADVKNATGGCQAVLWGHDLEEVDCFRALRCGARGILKKTVPTQTLVDCLRAVARGDVWIEGSPEQSSDGTERRSPPRLTPR